MEQRRKNRAQSQLLVDKEEIPACEITATRTASLLPVASVESSLTKTVSRAAAGQHNTGPLRPLLLSGLTYLVGFPHTALLMVPFALLSPLNPLLLLIPHDSDLSGTVRGSL